MAVLDENPSCYPIDGVVCKHNSSAFLRKSRSSSPVDSESASDSDSSEDSDSSWLDGPYTFAPAGESTPCDEEASSESLASPTLGHTRTPLAQPHNYTSPPRSTTDPPHLPLSFVKSGPNSPLYRRETYPGLPGSSLDIADLTPQIKSLSSHAFAHGGFSDIHWGVLERSSENGRLESVCSYNVSQLPLTKIRIQFRVVVKLLRVLTRQDVDGNRAKKV